MGISQFTGRVEPNTSETNPDVVFGSCSNSLSDFLAPALIEQIMTKIKDCLVAFLKVFTWE